MDLAWYYLCRCASDATLFTEILIPEPALGLDEPAGLMERQVSPHRERPGSSQSRKRPGSSLQRELLALTSDEGVLGATDLDAKKKRRTAAITSELKFKQG